ncbi:MAG TPA: response regulator [Opitutaceae bacterium]|nr:response regulator [Opitutaceae bacterium]
MLSTAIEKDGPSAKTRRVLYVDDMRELREVAQLALSSAGHNVDCVADGADAFDLVSADVGAYDIVITDHHMAGLNGIGLVIKLREIGYPGRIAIVSSELNREVADEYHQLGVNRILYKPVELSDLRALVLGD